MEITDTLLAIAVVAVLAPLVTGLLPASRVPQVVILLAGGILIGPQGLGVASPDGVQSLAGVGLGFVFLLAGYEIDQRMFGQDAGRRAVLHWVVSAVLAAGVVALLTAAGVVRAPVPVAIGLTTTALGTLLPILRDGGLLRGRFGRYVLAGGAVGELFPIIAVALFLGVNNRFAALVSLAVVAVVGVVLSAGPRLVREGGRLARVVADNQHETTQLTLRITVLLLVLLLAITDEFHLDAVLGAFVAGMVLRRWAGRGAPVLEAKLDVVGYGFFIPIFFVYSGMRLDLHAIAGAPLRVLLFLALMVVVRGLPALLVHRGVLPVRQRFQMVLITATTLPLLVALSEIGMRNGTMLPENAAALVGAGILTVLALPAIATALHRPDVAARPAEPDPAPGAVPPDGGRPRDPSPD